MMPGASISATFFFNASPAHATPASIVFLEDIGLEPAVVVEDVVDVHEVT